MALLRVMTQCARFAFWWLCRQRLVGGGPRHGSYVHATLEQAQARLIIKLWREGKLQ